MVVDVVVLLVKLDVSVVVVSVVKVEVSTIVVPVMSVSVTVMVVILFEEVLVVETGLGWDEGVDRDTSAGAGEGKACYSRRIRLAHAAIFGTLNIGQQVTIRYNTRYRTPPPQPH